LAPNLIESPYPRVSETICPKSQWTSTDWDTIYIPSAYLT
jgi:hypothetical protein